MKLSKLKLNPNNPQKYSDEAIEKLTSSVKDFPKMMKLRQIIYDPKTMEVLGGNKRLIALQKLGYKEIPDEWIKPADELTDEEKHRFIVQDNIQAGEWDFEILAENWDSDEFEEWGLDVTEDLGEELKVEENDYQIPDEIETDIVFGDLFQIGNHKLLCGDATKIEQIIKLMNHEMSDMIFTDPPYDLDDTYSTNIFNIAKVDSHVFIMNSDKLLIDIVNNGIQWFRKFFAVDFRQARLVSNNQPMTRIDLIAEFCKGKTKFNNTFDGFSTLIECSKIHNNNENINFGHKQAKRIELPSKFIEHYSNKGELVVDLFGGSGATMAACEQLNRKCYMMELDTKNCQIILDRMKKCYNLEANKLI